MYKHLLSLGERDIKKFHFISLKRVMSVYKAFSGHKVGCNLYNTRTSSIHSKEGKEGSRAEFCLVSCTLVGCGWFSLVITL